MPKSGILAGFFIVLVFVASLQLKTKEPLATAPDQNQPAAGQLWAGHVGGDSLVTWEGDDRLAVISREGTALRVKRFSPRGALQGETLVQIPEPGQLQASGGSLVSLGPDGRLSQQNTRGRLLWSRAINGQARILDLCGGEGVLVAVKSQGATAAETLYLLDGTGQTIWTYGPVAGVFTAASGSAPDGTAAAAWVRAQGGTGGHLIVIDPTGRSVLRRDYPEPIHRLQIGAGGPGGGLLVLAAGHRVEALEPGGERLFSWNGSSLPTGAFFLRNRIGVFLGSKLQILDLAGRQVETIPLAEPPLRAEISPAQDKIAILGEQGKLFIYRLDNLTSEAKMN